MHYSGPFFLEDAGEREWLLTNGLGGYASSTLCGMNTRRYHGLLVAALKPPAARTLLVSKLEEVINTGNVDYLISTNAYPGTIYPEGYRWLRDFTLDDAAVAMRFNAGGTELEKRIAMVPGENTTRVTYRNTSAESYTLHLTPLVNARDFHGETRGEFDFAVQPGAWSEGMSVRLVPWWLPEGFWIYADGGIWQDDRAWYYNMAYAWERRRGLQDLDNHFSPGHLMVTLAAGAQVTVSLSTLAPPASITRAQQEPMRAITPEEPDEVTRLRRTAESFLVTRGTVAGQTHAGRTVIAGYHWFGDWGRDTMIALPGLCLHTGHEADAAEILRTFAAARRRGLLPNLFMESGDGEAFNTVDAALWFLDAVYQYYHATGDADLVNELRPALEEIVAGYRNGTDFGICMADDGLIDASAPGWQLTWMDAKVGDWVVTPRSGKPVEINALWYHGLRVMEEFASRFGWPGDYAALADRVKAGFAQFWYAEGGYLYDVLGETRDAKLRPNQIFAVGLPHSPLEPAQAKAVVDAVERHLLTPYGLRTLAPDDPDYRGFYGGNTWERDGAYHQGTVWAWLIGGYVDAYLRVHNESAKAKAHCRTLLQPLLRHVHEAGVGSISEIFDGDAPHAPKGTISQAWSVAEILRAWDRCAK